MGARPGHRRNRLVAWTVVAPLVVVLAVVAVFSGALLFRKIQAVPVSTENLGNRPLLNVALSLSLEPENGIDGIATLDIGPPGDPDLPYTFLLNPALEITEIACDIGALTTRRDGILVAVPAEELGDARRIVVHYRGKPERTALDAETVWENDRVLLPPKALWYPLDLHSFHNVQGRVLRATKSAADSAQFVTGGQTRGGATTPESAIHEWETSRPVLGSSLIWGSYETVDRLFGQVALTLYSAEASLDSATPLSDAMRDLHGFYNARFGSTNFSALRLVVDSSLVKGWSGWDGVIAVPDTILQEDADRALVAVGTLLAENWWGATATGRWFSTRPEGGAWLTQGLSQYSAWRALRQIRGRVSFFKYLEGLPCVADNGPPLISMNLGEGPNIDPAFSPRGAFAALALADFSGIDAFDSACRSFLAIHRHTPVSYAAFMHELRLASSKDLDEMLLAWFERDYAFDYALNNVAVAGQRVQMTLENTGNLPAWADLEVAIVGERGVALKTVQARPPHTTVDFETNVTASRVVLDPGFATPDAARANNVWPRMMWPVSLQITANHGVIIAGKTEWCLDAPDHFSWWSTAQPDKLRTVAPPATAPRQGAPPANQFANHLDQWTKDGLLSAEARHVAEQFHPVSNIVTTAEGRTVTFFDHEGRLVRITRPDSATSNAPEVQTILDLPYGVTRALLSDDGEYAAWIDRAGLLRATQLREPFPRYTSVQGDILDFQWHADGSLYALAAVSPRLLPMRFHANYSLWRVDNETWNSEEVLRELEHQTPVTR